MNPYSHLVVASKLESLVKPENKQEYYWGAVVPDIRYLSAVPRKQTHLPSHEIISLIARYPDLKSFLQGFLIHCLSDELDLEAVFSPNFPFSLMKGKLSRQRILVILELYYFENESVRPSLSGTHNEVLIELGITKKMCVDYSKAIGQYIADSSPESRISELIKLLGLENDSRVDQYREAAAGFQKNRLLKKGFFIGIRTGNISERIISSVMELYIQGHS